MGGRPLGESVQIAVRVPVELDEEINDLVERSGAFRPTKAQVVREALARGIAVLREELGTPPKKRGRKS